MRTSIPFLLALPLLALADPAGAQQAPPPVTPAAPATVLAAPVLSPAAVRGKVVYERFCVSCHGDLGNGAGEFAEHITVKPRDYRQGTFKWRSTASGALPLDSDLEKTIRDGVYGTYMPSWFAIGKRNRTDVIAYIKTFSARWTTEKPPDPITIPPEPEYTEASVTRGRGLYEKNNCAQCHGLGALGDGPSAHELKDDWGNAIVPYDLTLGHIKCGNTGQDIYRVFITGLNGTPMPSFTDSISSDEAWALVHYIQSLSPLYPKNVKTASRR
jgi:mono/diheme cytochrome c family protein